MNLAFLRLFLCSIILFASGHSALLAQPSVEPSTRQFTVSNKTLNLSIPVGFCWLDLSAPANTDLVNSILSQVIKSRNNPDINLMHAFIKCDALAELRNNSINNMPLYNVGYFTYITHRNIVANSTTVVPQGYIAQEKQRFAKLEKEKKIEKENAIAQKGFFDGDQYSAWGNDREVFYSLVSNLLDETNILRAQFFAQGVLVEAVFNLPKRINALDGYRFWFSDYVKFLQAQNPSSDTMISALAVNGYMLAIVLAFIGFVVRGRLLPTALTQPLITAGQDFKPPKLGYIFSLRMIWRSCVIGLPRFIRATGVALPLLVAIFTLLLIPDFFWPSELSFLSFLLIFMVVLIVFPLSLHMDVRYHRALLLGEKTPYFALKFSRFDWLYTKKMVWVGLIYINIAVILVVVLAVVNLMFIVYRSWQSPSWLSYGEIYELSFTSALYTLMVPMILVFVNLAYVRIRGNMMLVGAAIGENDLGFFKAGNLVKGQNFRLYVNVFLVFILALIVAVAGFSVIAALYDFHNPASIVVQTPRYLVYAESIFLALGYALYEITVCVMTTELYRHFRGIKVPLTHSESA